MQPQLITADLLIPGRGIPIQNGALVFNASTILFAGAATSLPPKYASLNPTCVKVLMPGMWDCHSHFLGADKVSSAAFYSVAQPLAGVRISLDALRLLSAGFTSVRELGGWGIDLADAINEGTLPGPAIYSSVKIIGTTGGHSDAHDIPLPALSDAISHGLFQHLADGVPECLRAVRLMLRRGARVIKICTSGGVGSLRDDPTHQQFSAEEIKAVVEEAERAEVLVAAHAHGKPGILAALKAGVKAIEHGSYLDEECFAAMKAEGAVLVATRAIVEAGLSMKDAFTPESYKKLLVVAEAQKKAYAGAVKAGVKIALGTDFGITVPGGSLLEHGRNGIEATYAVEAGMTPLQAIEAATANGPLTLGKQAPKSGQLKEGFDADFIALDASPLAEIGVLATPDRVTHVWRQGKLWKSPDRPLLPAWMAGKKEVAKMDEKRRDGIREAFELAMRCGFEVV